MLAQSKNKLLFLQIVSYFRNALQSSYKFKYFQLHYQIKLDMYTSKSKPNLICRALLVSAFLYCSKADTLAVAQTAIPIATNSIPIAPSALSASNPQAAGSSILSPVVFAPLSNNSSVLPTSVPAVTPTNPSKSQNNANGQKGSQVKATVVVGEPLGQNAHEVLPNFAGRFERPSWEKYEANRQELPPHSPSEVQHTNSTIQGNSSEVGKQKVEGNQTKSVPSNQQGWQSNERGAILEHANYNSREQVNGQDHRFEAQAQQNRTITNKAVANGTQEVTQKKPQTTQQAHPPQGQTGSQGFDQRNVERQGRRGQRPESQNDREEQTNQINERSRGQGRSQGQGQDEQQPRRQPRREDAQFDQDYQPRTHNRPERRQQNSRQDDERDYESRNHRSSFERYDREDDQEDDDRYVSRSQYRSNNRREDREDDGDYEPRGQSNRRRNDNRDYDEEEEHETRTHRRSNRRQDDEDDERSYEPRDRKRSSRRHDDDDEEERDYEPRRSDRSSRRQYDDEQEPRRHNSDRREDTRSSNNRNHQSNQRSSNFRHYDD